jgi:hypothetical protein
VLSRYHAFYTKLMCQGPPGRPKIYGGRDGRESDAQGRNFAPPTVLIVRASHAAVRHSAMAAVMGDALHFLQSANAMRHLGLISVLGANPKGLAGNRRPLLVSDLCTLIFYPLSGHGGYRRVSNADRDDRA